MMLKKALKQFLTSSPIVLLIILIGIFFHFIYLDRIPVGLTHDDADVVVSMKTLAKTGIDVAGSSFPSLLFFNKTQGNISGLASFIFSPVFKLFELNLFSIHLLFVCINMITLGMFSYLVYKLTKKINLSILVFTVGLLNPWFFAYSRYPTEAPVALLFVSIALFFFYVKSKYNLLLSSLFFVFAFYSYYGAKISIVLLFPALCFYSLLKEGFNFKNFKKFFVPSLLFIIPVLFYFYISFFSNNSTLTKRLGNEFVFKNLSVYEEQTNEFRKISMDFSFKNYFYNKYSFLTETILKKYLGWMSPDILFFEGDPVSVYKFTDHGLFYVIDIVLFVLGISYFARNSKKYSDMVVLLLLLILIAPIGSSISNIGTSYFFRSFLLLPSLLIVLGSGMYYLRIVLKRNNLKLFWYLFLIVYVSLFIRFAFFYFARYPIYSQENNYLSERVLSSYVNRVTQLGGKAFVGVLNIESFKNLENFYSGESSSNLVVNNDCLIFNNESVIMSDTSIIYDSALNCKKSGDYFVILNQKDAGAKYKIYNDKLCNMDYLTTYKRNHLISDYNIEDMTNSEFCNRWIQSGEIINEKTK